MAPLILTVELDPQTFNYFNRLRQQYFPPARNHIPAHITLFHALPNVEERTIKASLALVSKEISPLLLNFVKLYSLGRGVAVEVECNPLKQLRQNLSRQWTNWLSPQDRQASKLHVTIQNKVTLTVATQTLQTLSLQWQPLNGTGTGLTLWYYRGGPWEFIQSFHFNNL